MWELRFYFSNNAWLPIYFDREEKAKIAMVKYAENPGSWILEKDEVNKGDLFVSPYALWFITIVKKAEVVAADSLEPTEAFSPA